MSDLFHESVSDEIILRLFGRHETGVMAYFPGFNKKSRKAKPDKSIG